MPACAFADKGMASSELSEYDFVEDVWYCHPPLPFAIYGGAITYFEGKVRVREMCLRAPAFLP